ncbi:MAG: aminopeptidase P family protein [Bacteroidota bacterium]
METTLLTDKIVNFKLVQPGKVDDLVHLPMRVSFLLSFWLILGLIYPSLAQNNNLPDDFLSSDFHRGRRDALRAKMPNNSVAVVFANPVRNRANDVNYVYHQDPNFYYLTGHREPHSALLVFTEEQRINGKRTDELIVVRGRANALTELYDGQHLGKERAQSELGFAVAIDGDAFANLPIDFAQFDQVLFYDFQNDVRDTKEKDDLYDLITQFKEKVGYPDEPSQTLMLEPEQNNLNTKTLDSLMQVMRAVKTDEELDVLRRAAVISALGHREVMKALRPGMSEREVQGMHEFIYKKYQAEYEGYPSIVGAGQNGSVLHYSENYMPEIKDGELVLMDVGAEYRGYTADITRTLPVNGKFTQEQKIIYDLVYEAQKAGMEACRAGATFQDIYHATALVINQGLVDLGIYQSLKREDIVDPTTGRNRYYPHGCCHHIGLDVHDMGGYDTLRTNMVITVEPGIYIPEGSPCDPKWWNIPVRIEDNLIVTEDGYEVISDMVPSKSDEVEALMEEDSFFNSADLPSLSGEE